MNENSNALKNVSVLNLSSYELNDCELSILEKGLSFVPTPLCVKKSCIFNAASTFKRRIKLNHFFRNSTSSKPPVNFVAKSYFTPPDSMMPDNIKRFTWELDNLVKSFCPNPISSNLNDSEKSALKSLKTNDTIVIKKADKGATTVIIGKNNYIAEAEKQLSDPRFYTSLPPNTDLKTRELIKLSLIDLLDKRQIQKKQFDFLLGDPDSHRKRIFYTLPKIHKPMQSWFMPNKVPPGRPIISDVSSPTHQIAKFISSKLKDLASSHPSYLKDTYDFLNKLKALNIPANSTLVTLDVKSLYTNIDNDKGLNALKNSMEKHPDPNRPDLELLDLIKICLTHNIFTFNNKEYLQNNGAAMGHAFCVEYANVYMAEWESKALDSFALLPIFWVRFIDDIFLIWTHGYDSFLEFFNSLNSIDPSIQLTFEYQTESINFLDVTIYKGYQFEKSNVFDTKVFFKETDSHQLLHKDSFHPKHTFSSVVKSQVLRFYRICNNLFDFDLACSTLFKALRPRGYSERMLRRIKHDVKHSNSPSVPLHISGHSQPCNGPRCTRCCLVPDTKFVIINGLKFSILDKLDCNSAGVVYIISCTKCHTFYVGETGTPLRLRLNNHINDIKHDRDTAVARHFNSCVHSITNHFRITPILSEQNTRHRKYIESELIKKFDTEQPNGLNERVDTIDRSATLLPIILPFSMDSNSFGHKTKRLAEKYFVCENKIITAFNRHKNLRDILSPSNLRNISENYPKNH